MKKYYNEDGQRVSRKGLPWNEPLPVEKRVQPGSALESELFCKYQYLVEKATKCIMRRYKSLGALTREDISQQAQLGLLCGLRAGRFLNHPNQVSYLSSYCLGYPRHAIHKNSRIVKPTAEAIRSSAPNLGHASIEVIGDNEFFSYDVEVTPPEVQEFLSSFTFAELKLFIFEGVLPESKLAEFYRLQTKYGS
jgi:hypothetical protein